MDLPVLAQLGLEEKVRGMFQSGNWSRLFLYEEQTYEDSTLKVLPTFEMDRILVGFDRVGSIRL